MPADTNRDPRSAADCKNVPAKELFAERGNRADLDAFDRIMNRKGGQEPDPEDKV
ncbi:hypothetical protein [Neoaquamicrobium microcysteis]|uniref:hypothetical protein n=1 Tax=Neoaquamicrobium microcysteis TaxID=2682781 RepID=UPI0013758C87|nr:hypothetical protein [Mesorhizobium microcysteis]